MTSLQPKKPDRVPPPSSAGREQLSSDRAQTQPNKTSRDFFEPFPAAKRLKVAHVKEEVKKHSIKCPENLPQHPFLLVIVAPRKSGKTNLLLDSLLDEEKYCHKFDVVIIWSRTFHHDSKWKNIHVEPGSVFTTFNQQEVEMILRAAEKVAKKVVVNALFIFDDMISEGIMNPHKMGVLETVAVRGRHANVSIIIISQQYMALSPAVRNNSTNSVFFRIRNGKELQRIVEENQESLSTEQFLALYDFATREPYSFLHVNNQEPDPAKRFNQNWDTCLQLTNSSFDPNRPTSSDENDSENLNPK